MDKITLSVKQRQQPPPELACAAPVVAPSQMPSDDSSSTSCPPPSSRFTRLSSPFTRLRKRLQTEDTDPVMNTSARISRKNATSICSYIVHRADDEGLSFTMKPDDPHGKPYTMNIDDNPFRISSTEEDEKTAVSSISNDSARRMNHDPSLMSTRPPPGEIFVRCKSENTHTSELTNNKGSTSAPTLNWQASWVEQGAAVTPANSIFRNTERTRVLCPTVRRTSAEGRSHPAKHPAGIKRAATMNLPTSSRQYTNTLSSATPPPVLLSKSSAAALPESSNNRMTTITKAGGLKLNRVNTDTTAPTTTTHTTTGPAVSLAKPYHRRAATTNSGGRTATTAPSSPLLSKPPILLSHNHCNKTVTIDSRGLLGNRPRRKDPMSSATVFSFGSIVGQSSLNTPTSVTTGCGASSERCSQHRRRNSSNRPGRVIVLDANGRRPKHAVQQDLELIWKRMAHPVRRWAVGGDEPVDLTRSRTGCLT